MLNAIKKWIYSKLVFHFGHHWTDSTFIHAAWILQKIFGLARFHYFGVQVLAGPVGYLDRMIISGREINPLVTKACAQYLKDGGVFLDIGANHGVLSLLAAKNPLVSVFAFEPSSRELNRFWKNLQLNPCNNISVLSYGLGETENYQELALYSELNPGKNSLTTLIDSSKVEVCHFASLPHLLSNHILQQTRVCKIDVEGQELFVLNALKPILHKLKNCIFIIEVTPSFLEKINLSASSIYDFFAESGFQFQFGYDSKLFQWDEVFFHPDHAIAQEFSS
jgi:FkbM family methyltransferase